MTAGPVLPTLALGFALAAACMPAHAGIVIYRCTDAYGRLTVQNDMPCPKGSQQERQVVEPPPPMPAYQPVVVPHPASPPPAPADVGTDAPPPAVVAGSTPRPPPPLYQCSKPDGERFFSEAREPEPRCVALQVVGLDGSPQTAAGAACELVRDSCAPVLEADACAAWQQYLRGAETDWRFGRKELAERRQAEYERIRALVAASHCAG